MANRGKSSAAGGRRTNMHVTRGPDGWRVKRAGAKRASAVERTQEQAEAAAKRLTGRSGGGEVRVHRADNNRIRESDTVPPARDPRSSRG